MSFVLLALTFSHIYSYIGIDWLYHACMHIIIRVHCNAHIIMHIAIITYSCSCISIDHICSYLFRHKLCLNVFNCCTYVYFIDTSHDSGIPINSNFHSTGTGL